MPQQPNFVNVLVIKNFSNYFDRKIFYYDTPQEYRLTALGLGLGHHNYGNINFNPADGVDTTLVLNSKLDSSTFELLEANYLIVHTGELINTVISRWYIMDVDRNAEGIYTLTLRRDVVAEVLGKDNKFLSWNAPIFVERGMLPLAEFNPLQVNDEGMNLSQIKVDELLLKDLSKTPWIVGYFANNTPATPITVPISSGAGDYYTMAQVAEYTGISEANLTKMLTTPLPVTTSNISFEYVFLDLFTAPYLPGLRFFTHVFQPISNDLNEFLEALSKYEGVWADNIGTTTNDYMEYEGEEIKSSDALIRIVRDYLFNQSTADFQDAIDDAIQATIPGEEYISQASIDRLEQLIATKKPILKDGIYYDFDISQGGEEDHPEIVIQDGTISFFDDIIDYLATNMYVDGEYHYVRHTPYRFYINYRTRMTSINYEISTAPGTSDTITGTIGSSHNILNDGSYSMFAMPLMPITWSGGNLITCDKDLSLKIANQIALTLSTNLIDLQLLPFAPRIVQNVLDPNPAYYGEIDETQLTEDIDYIKLKDSHNIVRQLVFFEKNASTTIQIKEKIEQKYNTKIESQARMLRLCSPNYSGVFEFNLAKNGDVPVFYVDMTYKPLNPFIRVTPFFNRLYGTNYKDGRGLICGGDFSLPVINDEWKRYENNNKAYSQIFARDIQNLEFKQGQERFMEPFQVMAGIAGGGSAGAFAGAKAGGPYGAVAGGILGTGAAAIGGALDMWLKQQRRVEDKDYMIDKFNLSLANIKAMPQSLSKCSALTQINKYFPFIEFYECSPEELEALENRIKYNGMMVGVIDTITKYVNEAGLTRNRDTYNYFKGQLIHANEIQEDHHFVDTLSNELEKGVYI